ncbi:hypothetical protein E2C01_053676 [Portunus trituberculatus]|uniref:Uncharacterized protein n=1 Tax=Portunus trituberculatus TaxID=210409 RepID=A0A5B7GL04_PORTR|nr:hypothetical protein [Portunus trituberculatus]
MAVVAATAVTGGEQLVPPWFTTVAGWLSENRKATRRVEKACTKGSASLGSRRRSQRTIIRPSQAILV